MAKPRVTATDRLANVIEVVELGQRTGLLSAERGSGSVLEEGEMYFASGRVIYAALAGLRGREALAVLTRWGPCRFSFERDAPRPAPNIVGTQPSMPGSQPGYAPGSQPGYAPGYAPGRGMEQSGVWPGQSAYEGGDGYGANGYGANGYGGYGYNDNGNGAGYGVDANSFSPPFPPSPPPTGPTGYPSPYPSPARGLPTNGDLPGATGGLNLLNRRPRRAPDVRDLMAVVTTHSLSRGHRTILLLADGEHTVLDLARLSSKSVDEVSALLSELEARGLVYYYGT